MVTMIKRRRLGLGSLLIATGGALVACSVDTSDIHFVDNDVFAQLDGEGGEPGVSLGGKANIGGVANIAGVLNKGGSSGKAGASTGGASHGGSSATAGAATGGVSTAGSGGMRGCPMAVGDPRQPVIDDFSDGDPAILMRAGRDGGWYVTNDGQGTQMPPNDPTKPPKPESPGYDGTGFALHTQGSGFSIWGAGFGVSLSSAPDLRACTYDVSPYTGVRLYLKGKVTGLDAAMHVHLVTQEVAELQNGGTCDPLKEKCSDNFAYDIVGITANWKQFSIPFAVLKQAGWGTAKKLYLNHVLNLEFTTGIDAEFDFWIDQVEFY
jgi:hypothetical protein